MCRGESTIDIKETKAVKKALEDVRIKYTVYNVEKIRRRIMLIKKIELPSHLNGQLYLCDNLELMKSLPSNSIELIYMDSPFFSGRKYTAESKVDTGEVRTFDDTFHGDLNEFLKYLYIRIAEMRRLLVPTGSIYVHMDWHAIFEVKVLIMNKLFGYDKFRNHIVWCYKGNSTGTKYFARKHDDILFYSKSDKYTFNIDDVRIPYTDEIDGSTAVRGDKKYEWKPNPLGKVPEDYWEIPFLMGGSKEYLDYPTQKPEPLLERIIKASSNAGDTVADFFGGSGTTAAVSQRLGRKWITCDKSEKSIEVIRARLLGSKSTHDKWHQPDVESLWEGK